MVSIVTDAFSRFAYIHPIEKKNSEDVLKALKATFKVMGEPIEIFSDEDTAFWSVVKKHVDGLGIVQKTTRTNANTIESLIRLKKELRTEFVFQWKLDRILQTSAEKI